MANRPGDERSKRTGPGGAHVQKLEPGRTYFDLDDPGRGPFVATGDEEVTPTANIVAREDVGDVAWQMLVAEGWGETKEGAGDRSYDQGAFGQEDNPRSDMRNAAHPGVGEGLTPVETPDELPGD